MPMTPSKLLLASATGSAIAAISGSADAPSPAPHADWPWSEVYSERRALTLAYISTAAYCGAPRYSQRALEEWQCGPACDRVEGMSHVRQISADSNNTDASALVGRLHGSCVVAFRGTANVNGWMEDLRSGFHAQPDKHGINCSSHGNETCFVGKGWLDTYLEIRGYLKGNLTAMSCGGRRRKLIFTGHSLGAAVAQLAMYDLRVDGYLIDSSYLFGSPRVGNSAWVQAFQDAIGKRAGYRVTFHRDPVPHLPMTELGYVHAISEVFYNGSTALGHSLCRGPGEHEGCASSYHDLLAMITECVKHVDKCDHLQYMTELKTIPMSGGSCVGSGSELPIVV